MLHCGVESWAKDVLSSIQWAVLLGGPSEPVAVALLQAHDSWNALTVLSKLPHGVREALVPC